MLIPRLQDPGNPLDICFDEPSMLNYVRVDTGLDAANLEKDLLFSLVQAAMEWIESHCHQPIFSRDYYGYGPDFTDDCLHSLNVSAVSKIEYQVSGGDWTELDSSQYRWQETGELFFSITAKAITGVTRIRVSYTAGFIKEAVPYTVLQAVRMLMAKWYDSRADEKREVPGAVEFLVDPYVMPIL